LFFVNVQHPDSGMAVTLYNFRNGCYSL
jgi:hypothetical protein